MAAACSTTATVLQAVISMVATHTGALAALGAALSDDNLSASAPRGGDQSAPT